MDENTNISLLHIIERPAFLVQNGKVLHSNRSAEHLLILEGCAIEDMLQGDLTAYQEYADGCLYLSVITAGRQHSATVIRIGDMHLFVIQDGDEKLQAFELAAQQLRIPLTDVLLAVDTLSAEECTNRDALNSLNKGLTRIHRILCNMTDAERYRKMNAADLDYFDLTVYFRELMEKLAHVVSLAGYRLVYTGLSEPFYARGNQIMLERAVSNLLTNAMKFSPKGSTLTAELTKNNSHARFSLTDPGEGIHSEVQNNLFAQYMRTASPEDSRHGMGLGLHLVAAIAAAHGGTTLVDHPGNTGTRVSFTVRHCSPETCTLRSPVRIPRSDYAGGRDRTLLEFADILPSQVFSHE